MSSCLEPDMESLLWPSGIKLFLNGVLLTGTTLAYCDGASGLKVSTNWMVKVHVNGFSYLFIVI